MNKHEQEQEHTLNNTNTYIRPVHDYNIPTDNNYHWNNKSIHVKRHYWRGRGYAFSTTEREHNQVLEYNRVNIYV